ncbi:MAG: ATP-binding protein [bacterium]|nr:ATP-binding protein [bacterium]
MSTDGTRGKLGVYLKKLKLPSFAADHEALAKAAEEDSWSFEGYLAELCEREVADRQERRIERLLRQSGLPLEKTRETLIEKNLPVKARRQLAALYEGTFLKRAENVLAFGLPGRGKTHALCAVGHELVRQGHAVLFVPAYLLVQRLLVAKRELLLDRALKRLDRFEAVLIDDIGYVQQDREEMEVLFTFLSARYERRSVMITSNLVFSQWEKIFKDPMTTACAIDRLVHHATILELTGTSFREQEAKRRSQKHAKAKK